MTERVGCSESATPESESLKPALETLMAWARSTYPGGSYLQDVVQAIIEDLNGGLDGTAAVPPPMQYVGRREEIMRYRRELQRANKHSSLATMIDCLAEWAMYTCETPRSESAALTLLRDIAASRKDVYLTAEHQDRLEEIIK